MTDARRARGERIDRGLRAAAELVSAAGAWTELARMADARELAIAIERAAPSSAPSSAPRWTVTAGAVRARGATLAAALRNAARAFR